VAEQTYLRVQSLYLRPQQLDGRILGGAMEALEKRFDPVLFESDGEQGLLVVGGERAAIPIRSNSADLGADGFLDTLGDALGFVEARLGPTLQEELRDEESLELLALRGALDALDRYSTIFSGKGTEDFRIRFSGRLQGIGSRIGRRDGELVAIRVFPGSPAEAGGLQDGDAIVSIDSQPTRPMTVSEAVSKIRGPAKSLVVLGIHRGDEEEMDIHITRGSVRVPTVETETLEPGIGYARIFQVSGSTPDEFREKVTALGELEGLVLDLRSNSGGSMLASARIADFFLQKGTIVKTVGREGSSVPGLRSQARATKRVLFSLPVVVLVDSATASAAEILSGSIAPLPQVTLIGQNTFGKGLVQRIYPLPEDNLLKLTVAEYQLSDDRAIHLEGIKPDAELFPVSTKRMGPLANVPAGALPYLWEPGEDDRFPLEVGQAILEQGLEAGFRAKLEKAEEAVRTRLTELGIEWPEDSNGAPPVLDHGLEIDVSAPEIEVGRSTQVQVTVRNPNRVAVPDTWATIVGPLDDLAEKTLALGTIPARGSVSAELEVQTPDGLSAGEIPIVVHLASQLRPVASRRAVLRAREHVPDLELEVSRTEEQVKVVLHNVGSTGAGQLRVDAGGAFEVVEELPAGAEETVELPLAGKVRNVTVALLGPLANRRFEIPLPDPGSKVTIVPPRVTVQRQGFAGFFDRVRIEATDAEGLREGWVSLDNEKKAYVNWEGDHSGSLSVALSHGEHTVLAKVKTTSGLAVYDRRVFTAD
jgi:carboxyl-terminal processing protease